jgi:cysteine synthase A
LAQELDEKEPNGAVWANQFDNVANRQAHADSTGPEIWRQTGGKVDGFICAVGSGGTLAGVAQALRSKKPDVAIGLADPYGANLYNWYTKGELDQRLHHRGIGQGRSRPTRGRRSTTPTASPTDMLLAIFDWPARGAGDGRLDGSTWRAIQLARDLGPARRRHRPGRLRPALPVEAVQSGVLEGTGPADARLDGMSDPLVTTQWLAGHLTDPNAQVVDATWYMPA